MKHSSHYLCFYFPYLPLEIFTLELQSNTPFALEQRKNKRRCILLCNAAAQSLGIHSGMSINQAYALCPALLLKHEDLAQQKQALQQLAIWSYEISPSIFLKNNQTLILEVGSCLKMHGSLDDFLLFLAKRSHQLHYTCKAVIAQSASGAYLLAKHLQLPEKQVFQLQKFNLNALHHLPLSLMEIMPKQQEKLEGMGLSTLGDLFDLPKASLHQRFGEEFMRQLEEIKGNAILQLPAFILPETFSRTVSFIEELEQVEQLIFPLQRLVSELCDYLLLRQKTLRQLKITLGFRERNDEYLYLGLSQNRPATNNFVKEMTALLRLKFNNYTLHQAVIKLSLDVCHFFPLQQQSDDLFAPQKSSRESPQALLDQLQARLGPQALQSMALHEDHRPERTFSLQPLGHSQAGVLLLPERPLWLLNAPRPLVVLNQQPRMNGPFRLLKGPERIASGWWDHAPIQRDYFIAQHLSGALYWLFQTQEEKRWYLHGIFS